MISTNCKSYKAAAIFVGGFTQRRGGGNGNGLYLAFDRAYRAHAGADVQVGYFPWSVSAAEIADLLVHENDRAMIERRRRLRVVVVGYSFGGFTAANIAGRYGCGVDALILIDPVARWLGRFGWTRSTVPSTIRIPPNVLRTIWFRQRNPRFRWQPPFFFPSSHDVAVADGRLLDGPYQLPDEHADIEDAPRVQAMIDLAVKHTISGTNP